MEWAALYLPSIRKLTVWKSNTSANVDIIELPLVEALSEGLTVIRNVDIPIDTTNNTTNSPIPSSTDNISCRTCKKSLLKHTMSLHELPGKYWSELIDCWSCHKSEFAVVANGLLYCQDGREILGNPNQILLGEIFCTIPLPAVDLCDCMTGKVELLTAIGHQDPTHFKIYLGMTTANFTENTDEMQMLIKELQSIFESQGICRFLLGDLYFNVISWSCLIRSDSVLSWKNALLISKSTTTDGNSDGYEVLKWLDQAVNCFKKAIMDGAELAQLFSYDENYSFIL